MKSGDLGAILTCVGDQICLAVVEALNFRQGTSKINLAAVNVNDLDADGAKVTTMVLQILELVAQEPKKETEELTWWWPQNYIQIQDNQGGPMLQQHLVTWVSRKLFHLLSPKIIYNSAGHPVWSLNHSDLERTLDHAWTDLSLDSTEIVETVKMLPKISGPGLQKLPYWLLEDKTWKLYVDNHDIPIPLTLVKFGGDKWKSCHFCQQIFCISEMRNHVGTHILKALHDVEDNSLEDGQEVRFLHLIITFLNNLNSEL